MKILLALALVAGCLGTSACVRPDITPDAIPKITAALDVAEANYVSAKGYAEMLVPFLSAKRVAQIREIEAKIERAFAIARTASTLAERLEALRAAEAATVELASP
jgi:hypothetical protein